MAGDVLILDIRHSILGTGYLLLVARQIMDDLIPTRFPEEIVLVGDTGC